MHAKGFLHKLLGPVIHKSRIEALSEVVLAAIHTKELLLTKLGRAIAGIQERSGIQKVNRLLGNQHLLNERKIISKKISELLIGNKKCPEFIVDWSKYPNSEDAILRASLAAEGRAITIYEERHPFKKMGNRKIQKNFLNTLKMILPNECQPIIITDAGFHNEWFKEILKLGWNYVGRIRGLKKCQFEGSTIFHSCKALFKLATKKMKYLGEMTLTKKNPMKSHIYLVKSKLKGRKVFTKAGQVSRHKDSKAYSRAQREPWLIASSLHGRNAGKKVHALYARRMTIEEAFRDMKSSRYGFGLEEGKTKRSNRRDVILLVAMLAGLIAWITGMAGEQMKLQYQFQSNSIKHRRVISLFYLGCQLIRKKVPIPFTALWSVIASLQKEAIYV
jgi:hypothetical protein